jgi:hypothetical protein
MRRRIFLKGVGGATLAAPFLSSMAGRAGAGTPDAPRRLVIFHTCAGCLTNRWFPKVEHGYVDAAALAGTTLEVLSPFASKLLFPRGLAMYPYGALTVDGTTYFDPHDQAMGSKLTAAPIDPVAEHWALGPSLDHVVAGLVNPNARAPLVLSLGAAYVNVKSILSYAAAREPYAPETSPAAVYAGLVGDVAGQGRRNAREASIIDAVRDDLQTLQRADMSGSDRQKLDAWLELLRETELACNANAATELGITQTALDEAASGDTATTFTLGGDLMLKLVTLAMMCDQNRSIVLQWPGYVRFGWDGIAHYHDHQGLSHRNGSAAIGGSCIDGVLEMLAEIDRWYAQRFGELIGLIDAVPEGDGSMLDNSAVLWLPELSDGNAHNVNNLPIVIAGSAGGYLRQGVSVNLEGTPLGTGNSEAYCTTPGGEIGLETGSDTGRVPLNKLYVTLLNALGATDGGAPFTSFGQVDSNDLEAGITNPGELEMLKA